MPEREPLEEGLPDDVEVVPDDAEVQTMEPVPIPDGFQPDETPDPSTREEDR